MPKDHISNLYIGIIEMFENRKSSNQNRKIEIGIIEVKIRIETTQLTWRIVTALTYSDWFYLNLRKMQLNNSCTKSENNWQFLYSPEICSRSFRNTNIVICQPHTEPLWKRDGPFNRVKLVTIIEMKYSLIRCCVLYRWDTWVHEDTIFHNFIEFQNCWGRFIDFGFLTLQ